MTSAVRVLVPVKITSDMITYSSIPEPDPYVGEVAWMSGGTYVVGDERTAAGSVWSCVKGHAGRTISPEDDTVVYWLRKGPTNRMAPFDDYRSTVATALTQIVYVIEPPFVNGGSLWQMDGDEYSMVFKDAPAGAVIKSKDGDLYAQAAGFYELLYMPLPKLESVSIHDVPLSPNVEVTITISAAEGNKAGVGTIKLGDWRMFVGTGSSEWGAEYGASSERYSYTYREYNEDGSLKRVVPRGNRRDIRLDLFVPAEEAMYADATLAEIIDTAVVFEGTGLPEYGYLNTLGFLSAKMSADNYSLTKIEISLRGNI